jgi:mannose-1-phosphate guanylyltransferase
VLGVSPGRSLHRQAGTISHLRQEAYAAAVKQDILVTLGIEPRWPETGYGYLEFSPGSKDGKG